MDVILQCLWNLHPNSGESAYIEASDSIGGSVTAAYDEAAIQISYSTTCYAGGYGIVFGTTAGGIIFLEKQPYHLMPQSFSNVPLSSNVDLAVEVEGSTPVSLIFHSDVDQMAYALASPITYSVTGYQSNSFVVTWRQP